MTIAEDPLASSVEVSVDKASVTAGEWSVMGDLTLRGVTPPTELLVRFGGAVTDPLGNMRVAFHASGSLARKHFGLTFELLKEAGGLVVGSARSADRRDRRMDRGRCRAQGPRTANGCRR